jgi:hypothetical protein
VVHRIGRHDQLNTAVRLTHTLAGGRFNPLIPIDTPDVAETLIDRFRVDLLYPLSQAEHVQAFIKAHNYLLWPDMSPQLFYERWEHIPPRAELPPKIAKGGKSTGELEYVYAADDELKDALTKRRFELGNNPDAYVFGTKTGKKDKTSVACGVNCSSSPASIGGGARDSSRTQSATSSCHARSKRQMAIRSWRRKWHDARTCARRPAICTRAAIAYWPRPCDSDVGLSVGARATGANVRGDQRAYASSRLKANPAGNGRRNIGSRASAASRARSRYIHDRAVVGHEDSDVIASFNPSASTTAADSRTASPCPIAQRAS